MPREDNPGVRVPPPFFYAAAFIGGWLLDRRWRLAIGAGRSRVVVAWTLVAFALFLTAGSMRLFRKNRTSPIPFRPANALVRGGAYRFTRNPMYVGMALLTIALGLLFNTWWPVLLLFPTLFVVQRHVIAREEAYLSRRFGAEYEAYTRQVRRWI